MYEKYDKMYEKQMYENLTLELHRTVLLSYSTVCLCGSFFLFFKDVKNKTHRLTIKTSDGSTGVSMAEYLSGVVDGVM